MRNHELRNTFIIAGLAGAMALTVTGCDRSDDSASMQAPGAEDRETVAGSAHRAGSDDSDSAYGSDSMDGSDTWAGSESTDSSDSMDGSDRRADSGSGEELASDTRIRTEIRAGLEAEESLGESATGIEIDVARGVATLSGEVADREASEAAEQATRDVDGVQDVRNDLTVAGSAGASASASASVSDSGFDADVDADTDAGSSELGLGEVMSDTWITTKVKAELLADEIASGLEVEVDTVDGWVTLSGTLGDRETVDHVRKLVEDIDGVLGVDTERLNIVAQARR